MQPARTQPEAAAPANDGPREWFTAAELAQQLLPGLPHDKRAMNRFARENRWLIQHDKSGNPLCRPRAGRGGGLEFHVSLLPGPARIELGRKMGETVLIEAEDKAASSWRWFDLQSGAVKAEAEARARVIAQFEALVQSGLSRTLAVTALTHEHGKSAQTIWNWLKLIEGVAPHNRLPALAPQRKGGGREAEIDDELWRIFLSDYLRLEAPTMTSCYDRTAAIAKERGLPMPSERALRRKVEREVDPRVLLFRRKGNEALRRSIPAQRRTVAHLHAMEVVNIDGHKFDVFVKTGDGRVIRPLMVTIQDIHKRIEGGGRDDAFAQLYSRLSMRLIRPVPLKADALALAEAWGIHEEPLVNFIVRIATIPGGLRGATFAVELATMIARGERRPLALDDLQAAWAQLSMRGGAA
jgi:hypothetical protein